MNISTQLIILNITKTGEKSVVLHTLSPDFGRKSFITTVSKSSPMAMFQPLNILDAEVIENPKSDLWRLRSISAGHALNSIRTNLYKNSITLFMSEVLFRAVKDGAREDGLFEWCTKQILTLEAMGSDFSNFHLRFLLELAGELGFRPDREGIAPFAGAQYDHIASLLTSSFAESMLVPLTGNDRNEIATALLEYLSFHSESRIEARSLKVLKELFTDTGRR